jgi:hypothetical protein
MAFDHSRSRWLGISDPIAEPGGPTSISSTVARRRVNRLRFVRGRDDRYRPPPAQIRTSAIHAYGSHLGCLTANRWCGHG